MSNSEEKDTFNEILIALGGSKPKVKARFRELTDPQLKKLRSLVVDSIEDVIKERVEKQERDKLLVNDVRTIAEKYNTTIGDVTELLLNHS